MSHSFTNKGIAEILLFTSLLKPAGAEYRCLHCVKLAGQAPGACSRQAV